MRSVETTHVSVAGAAPIFTPEEFRAFVRGAPAGFRERREANQKYLRLRAWLVERLRADGLAEAEEQADRAIATVMALEKSRACGYVKETVQGTLLVVARRALGAQAKATKRRNEVAGRALLEGALPTVTEAVTEREGPADPSRRTRERAHLAISGAEPRTRPAWQALAELHVAERDAVAEGRATPSGRSAERTRWERVRDRIASTCGGPSYTVSLTRMNVYSMERRLRLYTHALELLDGGGGLRAQCAALAARIAHGGHGRTGDAWLAERYCKVLLFLARDVFGLPEDDRAALVSAFEVRWPGRSLDLGQKGFLAGLALVMTAAADDPASASASGGTLAWAVAAQGLFRKGRAASELLAEVRGLLDEHPDADAARRLRVVADWAGLLQGDPTVAARLRRLAGRVWADEALLRPCPLAFFFYEVVLLGRDLEAVLASLPLGMRPGVRTEPLKDLVVELQTGLHPLRAGFGAAQPAASCKRRDGLCLSPS